MESLRKQSDHEFVLFLTGRVDAFYVGVLIALFERAVGYYASLININVYHQRDVEAGKIAAGEILRIQAQVLQCLSLKSGDPLSAAEIAYEIGVESRRDIVLRICDPFAANDWIRGAEIHQPLAARFASK